MGGRYPRGNRPAHNTVAKAQASLAWDPREKPSERAQDLKPLHHSSRSENVGETSDEKRRKEKKSALFRRVYVPSVHLSLHTHVPSFGCSLRAHVSSVCMSLLVYVSSVCMSVRVYASSMCILYVYVPSVSISPLCVCPFVCMSLRVYVSFVCMSLCVCVPLCVCPFRVCLFHVYVPLCVLCVYAPSVCMSRPRVCVSLCVYAPSVCISLRVYVFSCMCLYVCMSLPYVSFMCTSLGVFPLRVCPFRIYPSYVSPFCVYVPSVLFWLWVSIRTVISEGLAKT